MSIPLASNVATNDAVVWSADSSALYYHTGVENSLFPSNSTKLTSYKGHPGNGTATVSGYDEIHRIDFNGHDTLLFHRTHDDSSIRLVGLDRSGALILTLAKPHAAVSLVRLIPFVGADVSRPRSIASLQEIATLPGDILPGNVLGMGSNGMSVECERVLVGARCIAPNPLHITTIQLNFTTHTVQPRQPLFNTTHFGSNISALARSSDGQIEVMAQVTGIRADLVMQGIPNVPAQESLLLADTTTGATQTLALPAGGQIIQAFWTDHLPTTQLRIDQGDGKHQSSSYVNGINTNGINASTFQQDEWMLEGHANRLANGPTLPTMCYGNCPHGPTGPPHVSAAILHGVAYVESNWHQFNTSDYQVNGEAVGTPIESFDGGLKHELLK